MSDTNQQSELDVALAFLADLRLAHGVEITVLPRTDQRELTSMNDTNPHASADEFLSVRKGLAPRARAEARNAAMLALGRIEKQLDAAQRRVAELEQSWQDSASMTSYTASVAAPAKKLT